MSWNIQNLGETKYKRDTIIPQIAGVIKSSDVEIVAIQELVTSSWGDSCIIQLAKILDWNYTISDRTTGSGSERYAYLFQKKIKLNWARLDSTKSDMIDREPYIASFRYSKRTIIIRQIHIVPASKRPENEIKRLDYIDGIICGDFNLSCNNQVFSKIKINFNSPICGKSTSLKRNGELSENNYDHFFVSKEYTILSSRVYFYPYSGNRNQLSDHLPIILWIK